MIKPVKNYVLVKPCEADTISKGGIFIPGSVQVDSNRVEVVEVGEGTLSKPMKLKKGDIGFRVQGWGEEIIENGQKYYLFDQSSIIALQ